jgi:hypothetical protein
MAGTLSEPASLDIAFCIGVESDNHAAPAGDHPRRLVYDRLMAGDTLVLQLDRWDDEDHPNLIGPDDARHGHGVLLWFEVDDFDASVAWARALAAEVVLKPHVNPAPQHREMWLRDPDGYVVVIASLDGEALAP